MSCCDSCAMAALAEATANRTGLLADDGLNRAATALLRYWHTLHERAEATAVILTVGCPTCGTPAGHWCVTRTGNVYDDTHGPAYFHAARRRALADVDTPTAQVIELHRTQDDATR